MKVLVAYYSLTGNTKALAEKMAKALEKHEVAVEEIQPVKPYALPSAYVLGGKDAMFKKIIEIQPLENDPAKFDGLVVLSPVWAWTFSPPTRAFIAGLPDGKGKPAVAGTMQDGDGTKACDQLAAALEEKNYSVKATFFVAGKDEKQAANACEKTLQAFK